MKSEKSASGNGKHRLPQVCVNINGCRLLGCFDAQGLPELGDVPNEAGEADSLDPNGRRVHDVLPRLARIIQGMDPTDAVAADHVAQDGPITARVDNASVRSFPERVDEGVVADDVVIPVDVDSHMWQVVERVVEDCVADPMKRDPSTSSWRKPFPPASFGDTCGLQREVSRD